MAGPSACLRGPQQAAMWSAQWTLPRFSKSEIASAVSGILQQDNGVRKATGIMVYVVKSHYYYCFQEMGSLD